MIYAGIGSRSTPLDFLNVMADIAAQLGTLGWTLRSGHAQGADTAFEQGARQSKGEMEIFLPWQGFNGANNNNKEYVVPVFNDKLVNIAAAHHPNWNRLSNGAKKLHARNVCQILGKNLEEPAKMVICWTQGGLKGGGTGQAVRIANSYGIPVFDLALNKDCVDLIEFVNKP